MIRCMFATLVVVAAAFAAAPTTPMAPKSPEPPIPAAPPLAPAALPTAPLSRSEPVSPPAVTAEAIPMIEQDGQTFQLANRTSAKNVETDEYVVAGEKIAGWTQLLTVQRVALERTAGADQFLAYFQQRVAEDGASVDVLKQSAAATVFAVRFPQSDKNEEQVMICLAFLEPEQPARLNIVQYALKPARLNIVQYALKPARIPVSVVEMRLRAWKDKFVRQAAALAARAAQ